MLKAKSTIYLPKPTTEPARLPQTPTRAMLAEANVEAVAPRPGFSTITRGETFDPDAWGVDATEAARLVAIGAAELLPPDPPSASTTSTSSTTAATPAAKA